MKMTRGEGVDAMKMPEDLQQKREWIIRNATTMAGEGALHVLEQEDEEISDHAS